MSNIHIKHVVVQRPLFCLKMNISCWFIKTPFSRNFQKSYERFGISSFKHAKLNINHRKRVKGKVDSANCRLEILNIFSCKVELKINV